MEFKSYAKIKRLQETDCFITQKIHGTNAQIFIYEDEFHYLQLKVGSRSRWLSSGDDNFGFFQFVNSHREEFIEKLGRGRHYGEWAGPGINSGEGLKEKTLILFDWKRWPDIKNMPPQTRIVPVLHKGRIDSLGEAIKAAKKLLIEEGSQLSPGFMRVEGIVIECCGSLFKSVFEPEETAWTKNDSEKKERIATVDVSHLLQPARMEKLYSRDEKYARGFPRSLPLICTDYVKDLEDEEQISGSDDEIKAIKKELGRHVFKLAKAMMKI